MLEQKTFAVYQEKVYDLQKRACRTNQAKDGRHVRPPSYPEAGFSKVGVDPVGSYLMQVDVRRRSGRRDDVRVKLCLHVAQVGDLKTQHLL